MSLAEVPGIRFVAHLNREVIDKKAGNQRSMLVVYLLASPSLELASPGPPPVRHLN